MDLLSIINMFMLYSIYLSSFYCFFFFSSRRRHTRLQGDWSSDVCSSDLHVLQSEKAQHAELFRTAVHGVHADLCAGCAARWRARLGIADECFWNRRGSGRAALRGPYALQRNVDVGWDDVFDRVRGPYHFFAIAMVLDFRHCSFYFWLCGDVANGRDEHDGAKSRARYSTQPGDGGLRNHVHGRATDWIARRGRIGKAIWRSANRRGFRRGLFIRQPDLLLACRALGAKRYAHNHKGLIHRQHDHSIRFT